MEGDLVTWPDDAEVAAIKGRHFSGVEPLRCRDHRGVDGAEQQVSVRISKIASWAIITALKKASRRLIAEGRSGT